MKSPINLVTHILESEEFEPWSKRFFLFMLSQEVQCTWKDILKWNKAALWNKAVMTQIQSTPKKRNDAICSFVVVAERQLPQLQGAANNALSTLSASLKKYGAILWFIVVENKVFVIINVTRATKLLKDIETKQIHSYVIDSVGTDLRRTNPKFKSTDPLVVTFCPSDILEIGSKSSKSEISKHSTTKLDVKVSLQTEETHAKKVVPSIVNEPESKSNKLEISTHSKTKLDVKVSSQTEETHAKKVVPPIVNEPESKSNKLEISNHSKSKLDVEDSSQTEETHTKKVVPSIVNEPESKSNKLEISNHSKTNLDVEVSSQTEETHAKKVVPSIANEPESKSNKLEISNHSKTKLDVEVSSQTEETLAKKVVPSIVNEPENVVSKDEKLLLRAKSQVGKVAPFARNQPVAVFSKTSGRWVKAHAVCVQEDTEGIFVTVRRIDGYELDYDIENVRADTPAQSLSDSSLSVTTDDVIGETIIHMQNESAQEEDFLDWSESEYSEKEHSPAQMDDAARGLFISERQHIRSAIVLSDAEWFKRIETFCILEKVRSIKSWLYGKIEENEQLPEMITEILQELCEMVKN